MNECFRIEIKVAFAEDQSGGQVERLDYFSEIVNTKFSPLLSHISLKRNRDKIRYL